MCWKRTEKIKSGKITQDEFLECAGERMTLLNNILSRKANWIGYILRRNCLLRDAIGEQMTEVKGIGKRRTQLLDCFRIRRKYWTEGGS